ncbi:MAG TPA: hypothetical protein VE973_02590 [Candidatus Limnocylindria bacterium]|nr:hypothetical protein [Candidatus Limnocylindria bacterium]
MNRIEKYYKNKKLFFLMFIFVLGLVVEAVPYKVNIPQDPPQNGTIFYGSYTGYTGSFTGITNTSSVLAMGVFRPSTELISTRHLDRNGVSYHSVPFQQDNLPNSSNNEKSI